MHPSRRRSQTSQMSTAQTHVNFDSFTHLVEQGWSAECVGQSQDVSGMDNSFDGNTDLQQHDNRFSRSLGSQQLGGYSEFADYRSGQPDVDTGFNSEFGLDVWTSWTRTQWYMTVAAMLSMKITGIQVRDSTVLPVRTSVMNSAVFFR